MAKARALVCNDKQEFTIEDVVVPEPGALEVLVRTTYSGVSIGTEFAIIRRKLAWGNYPLATGYQAAGVVEEVGSDISHLKAGDKVYYRAQSKMEFAAGGDVSCVSGTHASMAVVNADPEASHGAGRLPDGVNEDDASLFVMPAVALGGVDMANPRMGDTVVVHGCGQIGLGAVAWCALRGCVVVAVDLQDNRLDAAKKLGASVVINGTDANVGEKVNEVSPGGADVVIEATGLHQCIDPAIWLAKPYGKFVWMGNYGMELFPFNFMSPHGRRLTMFFPCDDGLRPCRRAVMRNLASGSLRWSDVITHRVDADDSPALFDRINKNEADDVIGSVIKWS